MSSAKPLSHKTAKKAVESLGFVWRNCVGSHDQYKHPENGRQVTLPIYKKPYGPYIEKNIARRCGVTLVQLRALAADKKLRKEIGKNKGEV